MILDTNELNAIYWAIKTNKTELNAIENLTLDLIGRSDGNQSTISNIYSLIPKEINWNKTVECNEECSVMKNNIQKQIFLKHLFSSLHKMKLGTFVRQFYDFDELEFDDPYSQIVDSMDILEKMKFGYRSATSKDVLKLHQQLSEANFTYKLSTIATGEDEVIILELN